MSLFQDNPISDAAAKADARCNTARMWLLTAYRFGDLDSATRARDALASAVAALDEALAAAPAVEAAE